MKKYIIYYAYYPFDVSDIDFQKDNIDADTLQEAVDKLRDLRGKKAIEIFIEPAKRFYIEDCK